MICPNCQNEISYDVKFCRFCGRETIPSKDLDVGSVGMYFKEKNKTFVKEVRKSANIEMLKGIGLIILGFVLTGISYAMTNEGGTYHILWGISVYGAIIFIRGIYYWIFSNRQ